MRTVKILLLLFGVPTVTWGLGPQFLTELSVAAEAEKTSDKKPVVLSASIDPEKAKAGAEVEIAVTAKIHDHWHIYAVDKPTGGSVPTSLKLTLPKGATSEGNWSTPEATKFGSGDEEAFGYESEAVFKKKIKLAADASGKLEIAVDVKYMACNDMTCLPPKTVTVKATVEVKE
ncbi:MAG TPA: protein-disulfide reductase DsbD domain-containing protein [Planctomycetia bacterium]|nr:protein-disulfide reductase DsbD domain-containing protein [Planctomycetia bacterium]